MPIVLSHFQKAVLVALYNATKGLGKDCLNPQQVSDFFRVRARMGNLEPWDKVVDTLDKLVSKHYSKKCVPRIPIIGYAGYKLTRKGRKRARKVQEERPRR